jgi:hypothetical protein
MKHFNTILFASLIGSSLIACGDNAEPDPVQEPEPIAFPSSCMEAGNGKVLADGDQKLYFQNNEQLAWTAWCHDGNEYLTLSNETSNYGELSDATGSVRTEYSRIRIDAETLTIDVTDHTYTKSNGHLTANAVDVTVMPLGVAMACGASVYATTMIDLQGTPFAISSVFAARGIAAHGGSTTYNDEQTFEGFAEGDCGYLAPTTMAGHPLSLANGYVLKLGWKK